MAGKEVKSFSCPKCNVSMSIRGMGQTNTMICSSCFSALDLEHPEYKILYTANEKQRKAQPLIALGKRGKLRGDVWEVIGFMSRSDGSGEFVWSEYLLFNPYKGFRWLVESQGHWNFVTTLKSKVNYKPEYNTVEVLNEKYQHFLSGTAKTNFVIGEFYWQVDTGDAVAVSDFIHPPRILSKESSKGEITWSLGEYIDAGLVKQAFNLKDLPAQTGVAPNQLNTGEELQKKIMFPAVLFAILLTMIQMFISETASNKTLYQSNMTLGAVDDKGNLVTPPFELSGKTANLQIKASSSIDNSWIYLNYILFNQTTGESWVAGREISYYHGYDEGYWSEGSNNDTMIFPSVSAGTYVLTVSNEGSPSGIGKYSIVVTHDVPYWGTYWLLMLCLGFFPLLFLIQQLWVEQVRWSESDHPIFETEE